MYSFGLLVYSRADWTGLVSSVWVDYVCVLFCLSEAGVLSSGFSCVDGLCNAEEVTYLFGTLAFSCVEPVQ